MAYQAAVGRLERFARDDTATILIQGESGTGKTTIARQLHAVSPRSKGPFQHVVLSTLDDGVAGSELFGHVAGAFTDARWNRSGHFASAKDGTLFLDEIGKTSLAIQGKLLHAMENGEIRPVGSDRALHVNARIIAATNVDLVKLVADGRFLSDLYARLEAFRVTLPPLRERRADIPIYVMESVFRHAKAAGYDSPPEVHDELLRALRGAPWPNNLRELDGTMHRILLEASGASCLTLGHCTGVLSHLAADRRDKQDVSRAEADEALRRTKGNKTAAGRILGIDRKTLRRIVAEAG